jgi:hypothetical protein
MAQNGHSPEELIDNLGQYGTVKHKRKLTRKLTMLSGAIQQIQLK